MAIPKNIPIKNQKIFKVIKYSNLLMMCGKYIVDIPSMIVKIIAINFLFLLKNADIICPMIAPKKDITIMMIEFVVVL